MASAPSDTPKLKKKNLPKIESTAYSKTTLNEQVVFAIHFLEQHEVAVTVEEVVSICFRLFPQSFSLKHYTRWPDSALVIRRLNDARERGFVKGNPQDGFALSYKGSKLAERAARVLGLVKPAAAKKKSISSKQKVKKVVAPVNKKSKPKKPAATFVKPRPKPSVARSIVKEKALNPKKVFKKTVIQAPVVIKKVSAKALPKKSKAVKQTSKPTIVLQKQAVDKNPKKVAAIEKAPVIQKKKAQAVQPVQMAMAIPVKEIHPPVVEPVRQQPVKRKKSTAPSLTKLQAIQPEMNIPVKVKPVVVLTVSKEEKAKAEKIVRAMERSDAYKLYSKNGHSSKPSEFDFRNMLFATMESTPETLARNVNLFKGSAAIHNRQDLITFLDYCETNFASLLKPSVKKIVKKK